MRNSSDDSFSSVTKALRVLRLLQSSPTLRVSDVARELQTARSTGSRLLAALQREGFVRQDPETRAYRLGPALLEIGLAAVEGIDLRRVGRPALEALAAEVQETVSLLVPEGPNVRFIDSVESPHAVRVHSRTGIVLPANCTAGGKAILAPLPTAEVRRRLPKELAALTPHSITDWEQLLDELGRVRKRGWASSIEESTPGLISVGVLIRDIRGRPAAGIGIAAPAARVDEGRLVELAAAAQRAAAAIEARAAESR